MDTLRRACQKRRHPVGSVTTLPEAAKLSETQSNYSEATVVKRVWTADFWSLGFVSTFGTASP
jgi:hypothetical protein